MELEAITDYLLDLLISYGPRILMAVIILIVGLKIIKWGRKRFEKYLVKKETDPSLVGFLKNLFSIGLQVLLIVSVASMVGIETTSFIAVIGAAGLAIGLALQGSLANFAGSVIILTLQPFKVGHFIETQGVMGTVKEIRVFFTILNTIDNKTIFIPNGSLANSNVTNYSLEDLRRVDMVYGISYHDDIKLAKDLFWKLLQEDDRVLSDPEPMVTVRELGDSSVDFNVRGWVKADDYWPFYWDMLEKTKLELEANGITIPFPQRDVHLHQKA